MNEARFDALARRVGRVPRRRLLRWLAGSAVALGAGGSGAAVRVAAGCRNPGKPCRRDRDCCSGRCAGKRCRRSPGQGICTTDDKACQAGVDGTPCGGQGIDSCACFATTNGRPFCGQGALPDIVPCQGDGECAAQLGPGARCVRGGPGDCPDEPVCRLPCPDPLPA
jgi:hypothetical protein